MWSRRKQSYLCDWLKSKIGGIFILTTIILKIFSDMILLSIWILPRGSYNGKAAENKSNYGIYKTFIKYW